MEDYLKERPIYLNEKSKKLEEFNRIDNLYEAYSFVTSEIILEDSFLESHEGYKDVLWIAL